MDGLMLTGPGLAGALAALRQRVEGVAEADQAVTTAITGLATLEAMLHGATALQPVVLPRRNNVSPEARSALAERMRQLHAKGLAGHQPAIAGARAERLAVLYPTETPLAAILEELNRMDGPPVTADVVHSTAHRMHLRRPETTRSHNWTEARLALLRAEYPATPRIADLLARLNALPGAPVGSTQAIRDKAKRIGVARAGIAAGTIVTTDKMTAAREALIRRTWLDPAWTPLAMLDAMNALPGQRYGSVSSLYSIADRLGLPTRRPVAPGAAPAASVPCTESPVESGDPQYATPVAPAAEPLPSIAAEPAEAPKPPPTRTRMTPERETVLRRLWPDVAVTVEDILHALNALPGEPYSTFRGLTSIAGQLGLPVPRARQDAPPEPPPRSMEEQAALADAALLARQAKARAMLALRDADPMRIATTTGLAAREVFRLQGEMRRARQAAGNIGMAEAGHG